MSSRISFAAGGFIAAFLTGVLLVASLACEGGSPSSSTGSNLSGPCSDLLGNYIIASLDGAVSNEVVSISSPVIDSTSDFADATTIASADLVTLGFELQNLPGDNTSCSKVNLIAPGGAKYLIIDFVPSAFLPGSLETFDVRSFYNTHGKGTYSIEVSTNSAPSPPSSCTGTTTTLSNAWLNVVDSGGGGCCDCSEDVTCDILFSQSSSCCWGPGDWDMWMTLDPAGTISDTQGDVLIHLYSDPYRSPQGFVYVFSGTLTCADGSFSATDSDLCASISGTLDPENGSSGTLSILDWGDCTTVQCSSNWDDIPFGVGVCDAVECFLCEPLSGPVPSSPGASVSPQRRESPVLQRLKHGGDSPSASPPRRDAQPRRATRRHR